MKDKMKFLSDISVRNYEKSNLNLIQNRTSFNYMCKSDEKPMLWKLSRQKNTEKQMVHNSSSPGKIIF